jgi:transcriptional regulator with XRE-family HTH domain
VSIAYQIRSLRRKAKLSQKQLAKRSGMGQSLIARLEKDKYRCTLATLERVAKALGTNVIVRFGEQYPASVKEREIQTVVINGQQFVRKPTPPSASGEKAE